MNEKKQRFHIGVVVRTHPRFASLTPREYEVLQWVVQGKSNGDIAVILGLALRTVKKHLERVFAKLGIHSRFEAMALCYELAYRQEDAGQQDGTYDRSRIVRDRPS